MRGNKIFGLYFPHSSSNSVINSIHASKSFSTCIPHTNTVNSNPVRKHYHNALRTCFGVPDNPPSTLIVDALDECPDRSKELGVPPSRQMVLDIFKELVELRLSNIHICLTSRPEADIRSVLEPLAGFKMSLHDQDGQKEDIANYVHSVIYSDKEQGMKRWRWDVKDLVIKTLSEKANGMYECPYIFVTLSHTVRKVSLGCLSTGNAAEVSYAQCPSCA